jgi:hypothetical protein
MLNGNRIEIPNGNISINITVNRQPSSNTKKEHPSWWVKASEEDKQFYEEAKISSDYSRLIRLHFNCNSKEQIWNLWHARIYAYRNPDKKKIYAQRNSQKIKEKKLKKRQEEQQQQREIYYDASENISVLSLLNAYGDEN